MNVTYEPNAHSRRAIITDDEGRTLATVYQAMDLVTLKIGPSVIRCELSGPMSAKEAEAKGYALIKAADICSFWNISTFETEFIWPKKG